jgi:hypothetical protein
MRAVLTKSLAILFFIGTLTPASAQSGGAGDGTGGSSAGAGASSASPQGQTGVPTQNSKTFSRPLQGGNVAPPLRPYGATTTGVGTAPNGKPIGTQGSGPGSPTQR